MAQLTAADILNQVYSLPERERLTQHRFHGSRRTDGQHRQRAPCHRALTAPWGYAWSPKRITVSTVGVAKGLRRFLDESKCSLAVSLHHPDAAERGAMMPAERAFGVEALIELAESI